MKSLCVLGNPFRFLFSPLTWFWVPLTPWATGSKNLKSSMIAVIVSSGILLAATAFAEFDADFDARRNVRHEKEQRAVEANELRAAIRKVERLGRAKVLWHRVQDIPVNRCWGTNRILQAQLKNGLLCRTVIWSGGCPEFPTSCE